MWSLVESSLMGNRLYTFMLLTYLIYNWCIQSRQLNKFNILSFTQEVLYPVFDLHVDWPIVVFTFVLYFAFLIFFYFMFKNDVDHFNQILLVKAYFYFTTLFVIECENGFMSFNGAPCRPCSPGLFGKRCSSPCSCSRTERFADFISFTLRNEST